MAHNDDVLLGTGNRVWIRVWCCILGAVIVPIIACATCLATQATGLAELADWAFLGSLPIVVGVGGAIGNSLGVLITSLPQLRRRFLRLALIWGGSGLLLSATILVVFVLAGGPPQSLFGVSFHATLIALGVFSMGLAVAETLALHEEAKEKAKLASRLAAPPEQLSPEEGKSDQVRPSGENVADKHLS